MAEPEQFSVIFERHHRVIWTYLARLAGPDTADDVAGEVFTVAFGQRERFDPDRGAVRSWLYGIATNILHTRLRSEARARRAFARAAAAPPAIDDMTAVDEASATADEARRVQAALGRLSRDDRELIVLRAWEQLSYADIAETLGVPIGTVRSRLSRARGRLGELLDTDGELSENPTDQEVL